MNQFPNVIGAIDGSHIPIMAPSEHENVFVNRKNFHSINIQAICDHQGKFVNMVTKWLGSTHDSFILRNSSIWDFMEAHQDLGYILGDSAYPCRPWLMTPLRNPATHGERAYNQAHKSARVLIENTFGRLKRRFYCLGIPNRRDMENILRDIRVCATLYNIGILRGEPADAVVIDEDDDDQLFIFNVNETGAAHRARLIRNVFSFH